MSSATVRPPTPSEAFGPNEWLVDEMYELYRADPSSVGVSWQEFFAGYHSPGPDDITGGEVMKGAAAVIAKNMTASLDVPTATSTRVVPATLLAVNRNLVNNFLARTRGGKVSFTHLIGYAVVKALGTVPVMNSSYTEVGGKAAVLRHPHVALGLAVDIANPNGSHTLMVPVIKDADTLDFTSFWLTYEDLVRRARDKTISADDMVGATVSLTNPGTLGTIQSVPRLMPGQGVIVAVGAIDYPAEYQGADPIVTAELGVSKSFAITSTYDHRVIQGSESGLFLQQVQRLLLGGDGFYDDIFEAMAVPGEPVRWRRDVSPGTDLGPARREKHIGVQMLVNMYRARGHLIADLDPLRLAKAETHDELDPAAFGLTIWDLDREFPVGGIALHDVMKLGDLLALLRDAYCQTIGVEYMHIHEPAQRAWIQDHVEGVDSAIDTDEQQHLLERLNSAEAFEKFLGTKYVGHKRFGIDGSESAIAVVDAVLGAAADEGLEGAVIGMAHRGRLNVLANIVGLSLEQIFRDFEGEIDPDTTQGSGDVNYHKGAEGKFVSRSGNLLSVQLVANPSHLEAVDAVVEGIVRARQDLIDKPGSFTVLPLIIHGDAGFAGQGVAAETLNLSNLRGYRTGGTVHLVINNQVGFTTSPQAGRSSVYATDVAKLVEAPIFHVNGDDPEACVRVARLAYEFRQSFHKDVVIDMWCYRRFGHNEGDEPSYTQPLMYRRINSRDSVRKLYIETLVRRGDITLEGAEAALQQFRDRLQAAFEQTKASAPPAGTRARPAPEPLGVLPHLMTGVDQPVLDRIVEVRFRPPDGFHIHPKLAKQFAAHEQMFRTGEVDWALAEVLAFGSLLLEGTSIRVSGQDTRRGTFSQRHAVLIDNEDEREWSPLSHLAADQAKFWIQDSLLSEYAALGFEYGYSVGNADAFVAWEAQFGDFANGAQVIIDQFVAAAEDRWGQTSRLTLLMPHGYEGQGPEHSSARVERFLTLCAEDNMRVVNATTSAQYFHVLRRQAHRDLRRPLVVFTPKSLLRARVARSPVTDLTVGSFQEVLDDPGAPAAGTVRRVLLASGKVAYDAMKRRDSASSPAAIIRVEQLYPWPRDRLAAAVARYERADEVVWLQEEPENMGPLPFAGPRVRRLLDGDYSFRAVSRPESASPAAGSLAVHKQEQQDVVDAAFAGL